MAEGVVDALEMIDVDQDEREWLTVRCAPGDFCGKDAVEVSAIPGARKMIRGHKRFQFANPAQQCIVRARSLCFSSLRDYGKDAVGRPNSAGPAPRSFRVGR